MLRGTVIEVLMRQYIDDNQVDDALSVIEVFDERFKKRTSIKECQQNPLIGAETLDNCIDFIQYANKILSFSMVLSSMVARMYEDKKKTYDLEKIGILDNMEVTKYLDKFKTKTEKDEAKKYYLQSKLIQIEQAIKDLQMDKSVAEIFVKDSENGRDMVYAYYQGVKRVMGVQQ